MKYPLEETLVNIQDAIHTYLTMVANQAFKGLL
jgi:hypothetical protein